MALLKSSHTASKVIISKVIYFCEKCGITKIIDDNCEDEVTCSGCKTKMLLVASQTE